MNDEKTCYPNKYRHTRSKKIFYIFFLDNYFAEIPRTTHYRDVTDDILHGIGILLVFRVLYSKVKISPSSGICLCLLQFLLLLMVFADRTSTNSTLSSLYGCQKFKANVSHKTGRSRTE